MRVLEKLWVKLGNFFLRLSGGGTLTADRTLTLDVQDGDRTVTVTDDVTLPELVNDVADPGNLYYYGTSAAGTKGWHTLPPQLTEGMWRYSNNTTIADPTAGRVRANALTGPSITLIALSDHTESGRDLTTTLANTQAGDTISVQDLDDAANWVRFLVTGAPTDNGAWLTIPVSHVAGSGTGLGNNNRVVLVFANAGGGGGSGIDYQPLDADLTALAALAATAGMLSRTGAGAFAVRTITASGTGVSVTNGDGASANPTVSVADMVAAGGSHARGLVPDPGATAHANQPYLLGDGAAWVAHSGKVLGQSYVVTEQSTSSGTFTDLTTVQSFTFTLDETTSVLVVALCTCFSTTLFGALAIGADVDGSDTVLQGITMWDDLQAMPMAAACVLSLAAGSHTIKLQFRTAAGVAGFFKDRIMFALRV